MTRFIRILCLSTAALGAVSANAATVFSSGGISANNGGHTFTICCEVTNSFTLTDATTVTGFTFGGWTNGGDAITSITWGISSSADFAHSGTTALVAGDTIPGGGYGYFDVRNYTATVAPLALAAGTYWLTLANAATAANNYSYWDINNGPTQSYQSYNGSSNSVSGHAFTITGADAVEAVPEPATWAMMVGGFGLMGAAMRRQRTSIRFA